MPNYKTHSIHGELLFPNIDKRVDISLEDIKTYCMGPDTMIATDFKTFNYQHSNKTKEYFETMAKTIKDNKLYDNSEVMAFLYGQIDHFVLDLTTHPLIYYMTENLEKKHKLDPHGIVEHWIDDYVIDKYEKDDTFYYHKLGIKDSKVKELIDSLYSKVYCKDDESKKYNLGIKTMVGYDLLIRRNLSLISPLLTKIINLGDVRYKKNNKRVLKFLNLKNKVWNNPETGKESKLSFDDLWDKSSEISLEVINDVNNYIYNDKPLDNKYIVNDISFNTGLSCKKGQNLKYVKKYVNK